VRKSGHTWGRWRRVRHREVGTGKLSMSSPQNDAWGIEEQPDEQFNGRHFPSSRQAEPRTPRAIVCVPESRYVLIGTAQLLKEGSAPEDG
jgi:hypothetical protein